MCLPWFCHEFPMIFQWFSHDFSMILPCSKPKAIYLRLGPRLVFLDPEPWRLENVSLEAEDDHHRFMENFSHVFQFFHFFPPMNWSIFQNWCPNMSKTYIYITPCLLPIFQGKSPSFHMNDFLPDMGISGVKATGHDGTVCETGSAVV
jgi:hypothetical protein